MGWRVKKGNVVMVKTGMWLALAIGTAVFLVGAVTVQGQDAVSGSVGGVRYGVDVGEEGVSPFRAILPCGSFDDCSRPIWVVRREPESSGFRLLLLRACGLTESCPEPGPVAPGGWPHNPADCGLPQSCPEPGPAILEAIRSGYLREIEGDEGPEVRDGAALERARAVLSNGSP